MCICVCLQIHLSQVGKYMFKMAQFPPLPIFVSNLSNADVVTLLKSSRNKYENTNVGSQKILHHWICCIMQKDKVLVNSHSLLSKAKSITSKLQTLRKNKKHSEYTQFGSKPFQLPQLRLSNSRSKKDLTFKLNAASEFQRQINYLTYQVNTLKKKIAYYKS